jgi:error-prone DNA polymerase
MREVYARQIVEAKGRVGRFSSIWQFHRATGLSRAVLEKLAEADAFASLGLSRREALWRVMELDDAQLPLFDELERSSLITHHSSLPKMPIGQEVMTDYRTAGLSLKKHPVALVRDRLEEMKIISAAEMNRLPHGRWVSVAGMVLIRQRPGTASGIVFETIEDETGIVNLIIRPNIYDKYRLAARHAGLLNAQGYIERQGKVVHVMVWRMNDLSDLLAGCQFTSRDFH